MKWDLKKANLVFDEDLIYEEELKYRLENNEENKTEEEIKNNLCEDSFIFDNNFNLFVESLTYYLKKIDKNNSNCFYVEGFNLGWRNREGSKTLKAKNGTDLLKGILPDTQTTLYVWVTKTKIIIKCFHHDSPTGEFYYIRSLNKKELKEYEEDSY